MVVSRKTGKIYISRYRGILISGNFETPMQLKDEDVCRFQELYRERFGKEISKENAYEQGLKLLLLLKRIYVPMTKEQFEAIQKRRIDTLPALLKKLKEEEND